MKHIYLVILTALLAGTPGAAAQDRPGGVEAGSFEDASDKVQRQLKESLAELDALRKEIQSQQVPLSRQLSELESQLSQVRGEFQQASRMLDNRTLDLTNLRQQVKSRHDEILYLSNLLGEYIRNFESGLHIAELQRYRKPLDLARLAPENSNLSQREIFEAQAALLAVSLDRLEEALGGARFDGSAVDSTGRVRAGAFVLVGPSAVFRSADGQAIGTAEQTLGSLEPSIIAFPAPEDAAAADQLVATGEGQFPLDPTRGNAHKVAQTRETLVEHFLKGGPVMWPILALATAAALVGLLKWLGLSLVRKPSPRRIEQLLAAVARRDRPAAEAAVALVRGPTGRMLAAGVEHLGEPRELIEEVMYEKMLATKLKLTRWLPFIAVTASAAPLLGLLGTVTGIITTFKLITVFGSGDVKMLSSGISEALITTECGLYVAIPSLVLHAFLSRKARGIVDGMEKAAVALINQVVKTPFDPPGQEPSTPAALSPAASPAASPDELLPSEVVVIPEGLRSAMANMAERLRTGDQEAIGAALNRLNHSAVEFVNTVYKTTAANVDSNADLAVEVATGADVAVMEPQEDGHIECSPARHAGSND
jgi:biopolymer transport protein ExbB